MKKISLIGAGGHAVSCLDVIFSSKKFKIKGYVSEIKNDILSKKKIKWLGDDNYLKKIKKNENIFIAFANIGKKNLKNRIRIFNRLKKLGCKFPIIKSRRSYISKDSTIGEGTIIMHDVVINANVKIGDNCIINTKSLIEHDTIIGDHTHVSTGVIINGRCKIKKESFLGTGSIVLNNVNCKKKIISAGKIIKN